MGDKEKIDIKEKIADYLALPKEVLLDFPKISMIGNRQIIIENYKGIIEYDDENVKINTVKGLIKIFGSSLEINTVTTDEIYISGFIKNIDFLN